MSTTQTVFDRPQFKLLPDTQERMYANVSNLLEIALCGTSLKHVTVAVPAGFFTLMRDVFQVAVSDNVKLAIDETDEDPPRYVLSMLVAGDRLYDLWSYSEASLPAWMMNKQYAR